MSDSIFQEAYARVRGRHSNQVWFAYTPREITDLIYREIRAIDAERLGLTVIASDHDMAIAAE